MRRMELPGKRKQGRPKRRFMDAVREDMAEAEVTEEDTTGEGKSAVATPDGKSRKKEVAEPPPTNMCIICFYDGQLMRRSPNIILK